MARFHFAYDDIQRLSTLTMTLESEDYSTLPPVPAVHMDWIPGGDMPVENTLVSGVLCFLPWVAGCISIPQGIHVSLERDLRNLVGDPDFSISSTHTIARPIAHGHAELHVTLPGTGQIVAPKVPDRLAVSFPSSAGRVGASYSEGLLEIPTNLPMLSLARGGRETALRSALPYIGRAVLIAPQYSVGFLGLPALLAQDPGWPSLVEVLKHLGLSVLVQ